MNLYKLKHIPTGLYYKPSKGSGNLSKKGKIYVDRVPDVRWTETIRIKFYTDRLNKYNKLIVEHFNIDTTGYVVDIYVKTEPIDWVVEHIDD